jgi:isopenicillin-N epimerase
MTTFPVSHAERVRPFWGLDPAITFLNHGSFGACPRVVLEAQASILRQMEAEPVRFFLREYEPLLDAARRALALFVGAEEQDLVFVPNATAGVNTVLRSLDFSPGDELLTTDHAYNACKNALDFIAERSGAKVVVAPLPFPVGTEADVEDAILERAGEKTKICLLDHITSPTALVLPVESIVKKLAARGIDTLVDGAHAPGMVPLSLELLGAAYFTGNCHKWMCAPKGAAFLHVRRDKQERIHPLSISHGKNSTRTDRSRFLLEFDWTGTMDASPVFVLPEAIRFLDTLLPGGALALAAHNRALALAARSLLCEVLGTVAPAPDSMIGALAALVLPDGTMERTALGLDPLQDTLFFEHQIEVPIIPFPRPPHRLLRISAQIYNDERDYRRLAEALISSQGSIFTKNAS